jgi:hypothetical protein
MDGNVAQRFGLDTNLLAMSEIEEPLFEQGRGTVSCSCRWSGKKNFEHNPASML